MPYSGPASAYGVIGKTEAAYFKKINAEGGINGRKINFISLRRRLQPAEDGRAGAQAGRERRGAVHLQFARHAAEFRDPEIHEREEGAAAVRRHRRHQVERSRRTFRGPWAGSRTTRARPRSTPKYILKNKPDAKIAVLYQNDDYGKDYLKGLKDGLGAKAASMIVAEESYETSEPTIDTHIVKLKSTGADIFVNIIDAEIRGAGDQEDGRDRLEAAALPQQRLGLGRQRDQAGRLRELRRTSSPPPI